MQEYSQADQEGTREAVERFERMVNHNQESYFDVFQIESIFDFYYEKSDLNKAAMVINMGLRQHPGSTSLQLKYSTLLIEKYEDKKALNVLQYLQEVENTNSEIFLNLGIVHTRARNQKEAIRNYELALKYCGSEELADYIFEISFNLNQECFYAESRNLLKYYFQKFPDNENMLFELAYAYDKLDEIENGIAIYNKLLDINPYLENAWYNMGILYNKLEKYSEAIEAYNITIAIAPNLSEAYYNKANSLAQIGEFNEALNAYAEFLSYSYPVALTYYYMGDCWENLDNYHLAARFYSLAVELDPEHIDSLQSLGRTSYHIQDYKTSITAFNQALKIDPDSSELWRSLGKSYKKTQNIQKAKYCFKKALIHEHEDTVNWIEMYQFMEENESNFSPIPFLEHLLIKDKSNGAIHYLAAIIYNKKQMFTESLHHLIIARQLIPEDLDLVLNEYPALVSMPEIAEYINTQI